MLSLWKVVVFVFVLVFVVLVIRIGKVRTRKERKQRAAAKHRLREAGHTSALHLVSRPGSFLSIALRGRPEVFDGSRRAAEIEHVGHGTAGVAGPHARKKTLPVDTRQRKGRRVYAVKGKGFPSSLQAARYTASRCTEGCDRKIRGAGCQKERSRMGGWIRVPSQLGSPKS
jgi:hypothetical protein